MILNRISVTALLALTGISLFAADAKEEVVKAAKALSEKPNYSWKTTTVVPESAQFKPGPTEGKADKEGTAYVTMNFRDNMTEAVIKGGKAAYTNQDGDWQVAEEGGEGPGRFMGAMLLNFKAPVAQAQDIVSKTKELKKEGDVYSGDLTEEGVKSVAAFRRGGNAEVKDGKGSAKFWVKDGVLTKFEYSVKGKRTFNDQEFDIDRTVTTEIKDVGTTKVVVPEAAKKKLS